MLVAPLAVLYRLRRLCAAVALASLCAWVVGLFLDFLSAYRFPFVVAGCSLAFHLRRFFLLFAAFSLCSLSRLAFNFLFLLLTDIELLSLRCFMSDVRVKRRCAMGPHVTYTHDVYNCTGHKWTGSQISTRVPATVKLCARWSETIYWASAGWGLDRTSSSVFALLPRMCTLWPAFPKTANGDERSHRNCNLMYALSSEPETSVEPIFGSSLCLINARYTDAIIIYHSRA